MHFTQSIIHLKDIEIHLLGYKEYNPEDYLSQLTPIELERYYTFTHIKRKREFVASRILRHNIFGYKHIHYDIHGAPYIEGEGYISISHSNEIVGLAFCKTFKIGLDIEKRQSKAKRLHSKFLSDRELSQLNIEDEDEMTTAWSIKESLYKLSGRRQILFREDLYIEKVDSKNWKGQILNENRTIQVDLNIFVQNQNIITINTSYFQNEATDHFK